MNTKTILAISALLFSGLSQAALNGPDNAPWKAWADVANHPGTGIVVTASTYADCAQQFQDAMDYKSANFGYIFTNIHYCIYSPSSPGIMGPALNQLSEEVSILEDEHGINEFIAKRDALVKAYLRSEQAQQPVREEMPRERSLGR